MTMSVADKDVTEYLQEVNLQELGNSPLWSRIQEVIPQHFDQDKLVDMGTDLYGWDSASTTATEPSNDIAFYVQCLKMLEFSFDNNVVQNPTMQRLYVASIDMFEQIIADALANGKPVDEVTLRERLPLDSVPFLLAKRIRVNFAEIAKDNDIRLSFQALFLFLLRRRIPPKYVGLTEFLERFPELAERSSSEQTRLRNTANWMVLAFHTIQPRNNKSFIVHLIPKIVEGKIARYITGSGQTKATADRVNLFRVEGECEKIKRPPRKRRDLPMEAGVALSLGNGNDMMSLLPGGAFPSQLFSLSPHLFPPNSSNAALNPQQQSQQTLVNQAAFLALQKQIASATSASTNANTPVIINGIPYINVFGPSGGSSTSTLSPYSSLSSSSRSPSGHRLTHSQSETGLSALMAQELSIASTSSSASTLTSSPDQDKQSSVLSSTSSSAKKLTKTNSVNSLTQMMISTTPDWLNTDLPSPAKRAKTSPLILLGAPSSSSASAVGSKSVLSTTGPPNNHHNHNNHSNNLGNPLGETEFSSYMQHLQQQQRLWSTLTASSNVHNKVHNIGLHTDADNNGRSAQTQLPTPTSATLPHSSASTMQDSSQKVESVKDNNTPANSNLYYNPQNASSSMFLGLEALLTAAECIEEHSHLVLS